MLSSKRFAEQGCRLFEQLLSVIKNAAFRISKGGIFVFKLFLQLSEIQVFDRVVANGAKAKG